MLDRFDISGNTNHCPGEPGAFGGIILEILPKHFATYMHKVILHKVLE